MCEHGRERGPGGGVEGRETDTVMEGFRLFAGAVVVDARGVRRPQCRRRPAAVRADCLSAVAPEARLLLWPAPGGARGGV